MDVDLQPVFDNADEPWKDCAWRALQWLADGGRPFTAFDLTELGVPEPDHPARWGSLFRVASDAGLIKRVGYKESRRPSRHSGICRVWKGIPQTKKEAA